VKPSIFTQLLLVSLLTFVLSPVGKAGEIALSSSTVSGDYAEETDSQYAVISGSGRMLTYRSVETFAFLDLGLQWGTYFLEGKSLLHQVQLSTDYVDLITGISFQLYPQWVKYTLDLGYRLSVDRMKIERQTSAGGTETNEVGALGQQFFSRWGIKLFLGHSLFLGITQERQGLLYDKVYKDLKPQVKDGRITNFLVGYRFGGHSTVQVPTGIPSGPTNYNDPCLYFIICD